MAPSLNSVGWVVHREQKLIGQAPEARRRDSVTSQVGVSDLHELAQTMEVFSDAERLGLETLSKGRSVPAKRVAGRSVAVTDDVGDQNQLSQNGGVTSRVQIQGPSGRELLD